MYNNMSYSIISIFPAIILGEFINRFFKDYSSEYKDINKKLSPIQITKIIIEICLNLSLYIISIFYIIKLVKIVPFLFHFNKKYTPSLKGESNIGISTGVGLFLFITQTSLVNNARLLVNKYIIAKSNNDKIL